MDMVQLRLRRETAVTLLLRLQQAALSLDRGLGRDAWPALVAYFAQQEKMSAIDELICHLEGSLSNNRGQAGPKPRPAGDYGSGSRPGAALRLLLGRLSESIALSEEEVRNCVGALSELRGLLKLEHWPGSAPIVALRLRFSCLEAVVAARSRFIIRSRHPVEHFGQAPHLQTWSVPDIMASLR
jgi:hypothetical protein